MSDEILLTIGEDGKASLYDDTYDITIHCESKEEQEEVRKLLENPEPHWIPCSERLPKDEGFYIVTLEHRYGAETNIRFFKIENGERYWSLWGNENITAWMPKPEPFKGVTE